MPPQSLHILVALPQTMPPFLGAGDLGRLARVHPQVQVDIVHDPDRFSHQVAQADGAIAWPSFSLPSEALQAGARLRWLHSIPAGVESVLTPQLESAAHITLTAGKGPMGPLMAEHVVMLMLALARNLPTLLQNQAQRYWEDKFHMQPMAQLLGKTIAILGVGSIGVPLARICQAGFGMRVLGMARTRQDYPYVDRYFDRAGLHSALREADFVALCLPFTSETEQIVDRAALAAMPPHAHLINVGRGALVDEVALIEALQSGRLAGAGLDTTTVEPLPADSPLWTLPNVILTPHLSPITDGLGRAFVDSWCENIRRFAAGEPLLGVVDRRAGY